MATAAMPPLPSLDCLSASYHVRQEPFEHKKRLAHRNGQRTRLRVDAFRRRPRRPIAREHALETPARARALVLDTSVIVRVHVEITFVCAGALFLKIPEIVRYAAL